MTYILLVLMLYGSAGAGFSAEFDSQDACNNARQEMAMQFNQYARDTFLDLSLCVPKGDVK